MRRDSLASSRKAWRLIQSLIVRVLTNGRHTMIGGDDFIHLSQLTTSDHPFKVTRNGNICTFTPGLVSGSTINPSAWVIRDGGGITIPSGPRFLCLAITTLAATPIFVETPDAEYYVVPTGGLGAIAGASIAIQPPVVSLGGYSITAMTTSDTQLTVPVAYFDDDRTVQLLKRNIAIVPQANHNNILQFT